MNKKIILSVCIAIIIIAVIAVAVIFLNKDDNPVGGNIKRDELFYTKDNVAEEGMEPINKDIILGDLLQQVKTNEVKRISGITNEEANKLIDLGRYQGLEKKAAIYEDKNEYTEIWTIKISEAGQDRNIFRMFNERIEKLRGKYKDNAKISEILNNEKNIIMKQQQGIAIVIISNNAAEIEKTIDLGFIE